MTCPTDCQYSKDVGMWPEHRCAVKCQYATPPPAPTAAEQAQPPEPEFFTVFALYEGGGERGWIALPGYSNETINGVKNLVLESARKEGYKGTVTGRLQELGWDIRPVYATPVPEQAQPAGVTEDARDAARYRWLRDNHETLSMASDITYELPGHMWDESIDAARAQGGGEA